MEGEDSQGESEDVLRKLGERIAGFRERRGWDRGKLAQRLGVRRERLRNWELGVNAPPLAALLGLREALGEAAGLAAAELRRYRRNPLLALEALAQEQTESSNEE